MDLPNPELLKKLAETIGYGQTIVGGFVAILAAVGVLLKWGFTPFRWVASKISLRKKPPVESPLRFVLDERQSFWGKAGSDTHKGTQVHGFWHVTNVSNRDVVLLSARLGNYDTEIGMVATKGPDPKLGIPTCLIATIAACHGTYQRWWRPL